MPHNKKQGLCLSFIMSFIMIYVMAALNIDVRQGYCSAQAWLIALQRLPLGFVVGILCDLLVCTPLSRRVVALMTGPRCIYLYTGCRQCLDCVKMSVTE